MGSVRARVSGELVALFVAQALEEALHLLTRDSVLPEYSDLVIPV